MNDEDRMVALERRIVALEARNEALEKRNEALEVALCGLGRLTTGSETLHHGLARLGNNSEFLNLRTELFALSKTVQERRFSALPDAGGRH